jgi:hypothetical protein
MQKTRSFGCVSSLPIIPSALTLNMVSGKFEFLTRVGVQEFVIKNFQLRYDRPTKYRPIHLSVERKKQQKFISISHNFNCLISKINCENIYTQWAAFNSAIYQQKFSFCSWTGNYVFRCQIGKLLFLCRLMEHLICCRINCSLLMDLFLFKIYFLIVDWRKVLKRIFGDAKMASHSPEIIDVMFIWTWTKITTGRQF